MGRSGTRAVSASPKQKLSARLVRATPLPPAPFTDSTRDARLNLLFTSEFVSPRRASVEPALPMASATLKNAWSLKISLVFVIIVEGIRAETCRKTLSFRQRHGNGPSATVPFPSTFRLRLPVPRTVDRSKVDIWSFPQD